MKRQLLKGLISVAIVASSIGVENSVASTVTLVNHSGYTLYFANEDNTSGNYLPQLFNGGQTFTLKNNASLSSQVLPSTDPCASDMNGNETVSTSGLIGFQSRQPHTSALTSDLAVPPPFCAFSRFGCTHGLLGIVLVCKNGKPGALVTGAEYPATMARVRVGFGAASENTTLTICKMGDFNSNTNLCK